MTKEEAITIMQLYKEELEHRIAKIDYDLGTIDLYSIHLDAFEVAIEALSAEAEPTVIRSRTLMPTKDFKEWAKRIREVNHNAVVIPCDAEVVSADAVRGEWILVKGNNGKDYHKCSKCLHTQEITGVKNYCAVCGARMKGGAK